MVRKVADYGTMGVELNANPEDLKEAFEKLTIQYPPEDNSNMDEGLRKYDSIKREDDRAEDKKDAIYGRFHKVGSLRNANPSYRQKNRFVMDQPVPAQMVPLPHCRTAHVNLAFLGVDRPSIIQSRDGFNLGARFDGIRGRITIILVPMMMDFDASDICRLTSERGRVQDNCLHIIHNVQPGLFVDFGQIFLAWNGPVDQREFTIPVHVSVIKHDQRRTRRVTSCRIVVRVTLPAPNPVACMYQLPAIPGQE